MKTKIQDKLVRKMYKRLKRHGVCIWLTREKVPEQQARLAQLLIVAENRGDIYQMIDVQTLRLVRHAQDADWSEDCQCFVLLDTSNKVMQS